MKPDSDLHSLTIQIADVFDGEQAAAIDAYVLAHVGGEIFHRPHWMRAVERGTGQKAVVLTARDATASIVGILPLTDMHHMLFGRALVSAGFGVGGGVLADRPSVVRLLAAAAQDWAMRNCVGSIELRGGADHLPEDWHREDGAHCNFAWDLASDDDAQLTAIKRKQRAEVRKGLDNNLTIETGNTDALAVEHYALYALSVRNLGTPVFPKSLFDAMRAEFGDDAEILTVRSPDGAALASVFSLYHKGVVMPYWGGGGDAARAFRANEVMYYKLMCHARARGCSRFDFGRSKVGAGSYNFKKNFGMEPTSLTYAEWSADGTVRDISPTSGKFAMMINIWKRLPLPIANTIGPWLSRGLG
jgi:FemAB-related protein (PEP-CTERM system-associated)